MLFLGAIFAGESRLWLVSWARVWTTEEEARKTNSCGGGGGGIFFAAPPPLPHSLSLSLAAIGGCVTL